MRCIARKGHRSYSCIFVTVCITLPCQVLDLYKFAILNKLTYRLLGFCFSLFCDAYLHCVPKKIYIDCALDIFSMLPCLLCFPICVYIGLLSMYFYYCTHCCVCQLDTKENDDDDDDDDDDQTFGNNFVKSYPIFKVLSLLKRGRNIQQNRLILSTTP